MPPPETFVFVFLFDFFAADFRSFAFNILSACLRKRKSPPSSFQQVVHFPKCADFRQSTRLKTYLRLYILG